MTTQLARPAVAPAGHWNTLQILKASRVAIIAFDVLLLIAVLVATWVHRDAMTAIGMNAAPNIIAAQQIRYRLAGMDADAANELLGPPNTASQATADFDEQEIEASAALIDAAKNENYASERAPLEALELSIATYERLIQEAQDLHDSRNPDDVGYDVRYYRAASILMDGTLLAAADDLDKANDTELDHTYKEHVFSSIAAASIPVFSQDWRCWRRWCGHRYF